MRARSLLWVAAGCFAILALAWWLWPRAQEWLRHASPAAESRPAGEPEPGAAAQAARPAEPSPPVAVAPNDDLEGGTSEAHADDEHAPARTADLLLYARRPMSAVPHRVVRAWGATDDPKKLGLVGAYVIVEPGISDDQLTQLCRDIRDYHGEANALSVRIFDSEDAATYDRHVDGGALKDQHQVATVSRDPKLGLDEFRVRGELVKP